jgi:16S rRNA (adenine1518-N6/adenine1519-N6)-dimethyltransferase
MPNVPQPINYNSPTALRAFLDERGIAARKIFGQNFLVAPDARRLLVDALELSGDCNVWEVGPGLGAVSGAILERGAKLAAFEVDRAFCTVLRELFSGNKNFTLVEGDAMKTVVQYARTFLQEAPPPTLLDAYLFGNLPYNISAVFLANLLEEGLLFKRIVITIQKELAERITAKSGSKNYCPLSVYFSFFYEAKTLGIFKSAYFYPVPNVDSTALRFALKANAAEQNFPREFFIVTRALFAQRRKTVLNNLSALLGTKFHVKENAAAAKALLAKSKIPEQSRAEQLEPEQFLALAMLVRELVEN